MNLETGGELVVRALEKLGVEYVFGIPGVHNLGIYDSLMDSPIREITARHEQGAGFMASGYARVSGKPGVALVITGPGLTNIITAMGQAFHDSVPMLVISSQKETSALPYRSGYLHELKNSTILASSVSKESRLVDNTSMIERAIFEAWNISLSGRPGPVHLEIPVDILTGRGPVPATAEPFHFASLLMDDSLIGLANRRIGSSPFPVILAGGGAVGASEEITALAERISAPVVQTCAGKGVVSERHPLCIGSRIHFPPVRTYLERCDLVIALGTEFSPTDFWRRSIKLGKDLISVNTDTAAFYNQHVCSISIEGDVKRIIRAFLERGVSSLACADERRKDVHVLLGKCSDILEDVTGMGKELSSMLSLLHTIRAVLPPNGLLCTDMTSPAYVGISEFPVSLPLSFLHPVGFGSLGAALPTAIGSKMAMPERAVCVLAGDGGFQFSLPELAVAAELGSSLPVIIWNDCCYGEIRRNQERRHPGRTIAVDQKCINFDALAGVYGIGGKRITDMAQLPDVLNKAFSACVPTVVDIKVKECFERHVG